MSSLEPKCASSPFRKKVLEASLAENGSEKLRSQRLPAGLRRSMDAGARFFSGKAPEDGIKDFILNSISDMVAFYPDAGLVPAWVNQALVEASGYPQTALLDMTCHQCWSQSDTPCAGCPVLKTFETAQAAETEVQHPAGRVWRVRSFPVIGGNEELEGVVKVSRDITRQKKAEQAFAASEEKYRLLFHSAPVGICFYDETGRILECNPSCESITGTPREGLIGLNLLKTARDADFVNAVAGSLAGHKTHYAGDYVSVTGRRKSFLKVDFAPLYNPAGALIGGVAVGEDVLEQVVAEKAMRASEEKYRQLFEGLPIGLFHTTLDGRLIDLNQAALRIMHCPGKGALEGLDTRRSYFNPRDGERLRSRLREKGYVENFETRFVRGDDSIIWVNISARAIYGTGGDIIAIEGSFQDITMRKDNENRLEESEARFRGLAERSSDIIVLFDKACKPVFWSPSSEQILGYSREALMSMRGDEFMTPVQYTRIRGYMAGIFKSGQTQNFELPMIRKDGSETIIEWTATPVHNGMEVTGIQFIGRDITLRKKAEAALRKSHEELRSLSKHLESAREQERMTIAREVHDDLGQALTAIKFDLAWLKRKMGSTDPEQMEEKIDMSIQMTNAAVQSVKQIASRLRPELLNDLGLEAAMEWYMDDFRKRTGIATQLKIDLGPLADGDIPNDLCISVFRVFQEALTNVARHSGATKLFVNFKYVGGGLQLWVHDNGQGIDQEAVNTTESFGLVGIRERINALDGEMQITGGPGEGTTLEIKLPLIRGEAG